MCHLESWLLGLYLTLSFFGILEYGLGHIFMYSSDTKP